MDVCDSCGGALAFNKQTGRWLAYVDPRYVGRLCRGCFGISLELWHLGRREIN